MKRFFRKIVRICGKQVEEAATNIRRFIYWSDARQRHHDYYVFLSRQGKLSPFDQKEYEFAMLREKKGQVKPFPEDATSPLG